MKKILALVMLLCLLVPACALAADTLTVRQLDDQGNPGDTIAKNADGAYVLENGASYVMQGESLAGVKLHVSGEADVLLNGVRVDTTDEFALHVMGDGKLNLIANGENSLVSSCADKSNVQYFKDLYGDDTLGGGGLYAQAETVISSISSNASLHIEGSLFGGFAQGVNVHAAMSGLTAAETNDDGYDAFERDGSGSFTVHEEVALQVRDDGYEEWICADSTWVSNYDRLRTLPAGVKLTFYDENGNLYTTAGAVMGEPYPLLNYPPVQEGMIFTGWQSGGETYTDYVAPETSMTFSPILKPSVNVIYKTQDGTQQSYPYPVDPDAFIPDRYDDVFGEYSLEDGKTLAYWQGSDGKQYKPGATYQISGDLTLTAEVVTTVTIRLLGPGGDLWHEEKVGINTLYGVSDYLAPGFLYWEKLPDGEMIYHGDTFRVTGDVTLMAVVNPIVEVEFDYGDGTPIRLLLVPEGEVERTLRQAYGREGFVHTGWKVSDVDMVLPFDTAFYAERDLTFIAQYEEAETVKLTYLDSQGGLLYTDYVPKGAAYDIIADYDKLIGDQVVLNGLRHWVSGGRSYERGTTIYPTQDMTFTAELERQGHISVWVVDEDKIDDPDSYAAQQGVYDGSKFYVDDIAWYAVPTKGRAPAYIQVRNPGGMLDRRYELGEWLEFGADVQDGALIVVYWKELNAVKIPDPEGGVMLDQPTVSEVAAADLPQTGDPSMLGAWVALLGAAGAMGMRMRRKN